MSSAKKTPTAPLKAPASEREGDGKCVRGGGGVGVCERGRERARRGRQAGSEGEREGERESTHARVSEPRSSISKMS